MTAAARKTSLTPQQRRAFGERVRACVDRMGGREHAAAAAGISRSQLTSWMAGKSTPNAFALARLAHGANLEIAWVIRGNGPKHEWSEKDARRRDLIDLRLLVDDLGRGLYAASGDPRLRASLDAFAKLAAHLDLDAAIAGLERR